IIPKLGSLLGPDHVLTGPAMAPYLSERRGLFKGRAVAVAKPGTTEEVAALVRIARECGVPIVPQGGNTGLVGGQIPVEQKPALILSLARLNRVRAVDPEGNTLVIEAGATLAEAHRAARSVGRFYPLTLAPEEYC